MASNMFLSVPHAIRSLVYDMMQSTILCSHLHGTEGGEAAVVFEVGESLGASAGGSGEIGVRILGGADVGFAFAFISIRVLGRLVVWSSDWSGD